MGLDWILNKFSKKKEFINGDDYKSLIIDQYLKKIDEKIKNRMQEISKSKKIDYRISIFLESDIDSIILKEITENLLENGWNLKKTEENFKSEDKYILEPIVIIENIDIKRPTKKPIKKKKPEPKIIIPFTTPDDREKMNDGIEPKSNRKK